MVPQWKIRATMQNWRNWVDGDTGQQVDNLICLAVTHFKQPAWLFDRSLPVWSVAADLVAEWTGELEPEFL